MVLSEVRPAGAAAALEEPHVQEVPTSRTPLTPEEAADFRQRVVEFGKASTEKWMPLHTVAAAGQTVMVARLLRAGVDIDARDADGLTALHRAVFNGREAMVKQLAKSGADVAVLDEGGATLLHYAAQNGSTAAARVLCSCGINVDLTDKGTRDETSRWGCPFNAGPWTCPLAVQVLGAARSSLGHWRASLGVAGLIAQSSTLAERVDSAAPQSGRAEMVRCLLLQGARHDIRNNDGATPLEVALSFGRGFGFHLPSAAIAAAATGLGKAAEAGKLGAEVVGRQLVAAHRARVGAPQPERDALAVVQPMQRLQ
eukprot:SM000243S08600  [mRNA]  locus=s243:174409:177138:- [translate_table: standard]